MKTTTPTSRHGFTLLELSIVLIIIGLLIGGVLGVRSYLGNAERNTVMNEAKYFIAAYGQFQERYGGPPGDFCSQQDGGQCDSTDAVPTTNTVWPTAKNGDGNGLIRAAGTAFPKERYYAFQHLALAGFIQGTFTGVANSNGGATIGENVPGTSMDKVAFLFDHPDAQDGDVQAAETQYFPTSTAGLYGNVLIVAGNADSSASVPDQAFLTPKEALQLDEKFDDGVPSTGWVLTAESNTNCYSGSAYDVATSPNGKNCYFVLRMQQ